MDIEIYGIPLVCSKRTDNVNMLVETSFIIIEQLSLLLYVVYQSQRCIQDPVKYLRPMFLQKQFTIAHLRWNYLRK